ncbi:MAG TPA: chromosomal replication initiator protein DnaA [Aestuariivirgaceae bacterium]|jgi:chromosomal replication initiator protein
MSDAEKDGLKGSWNNIAKRLRAELGEDLYSSWFVRMEAEECRDGQLAVSVPTRFLRNWIQSHYADKLLKVAQSELGAVETVAIHVRTRGLPTRPAELVERQLEPVELQATPPAPEPVALEKMQIDRGSPLDPSCTFETFIVGASNALAHSAAMRVANAAPGSALAFNPLFVHSAAGLGKTHLLNAIAWYIRRMHPERRVLFISAERFMYHFINALKARDVINFKDYFQSIDVLLIDDFQFLQGKSMQQEFCHTFNSLVDNKRQVIVAADVPPAQLESIDQRMRSRLTGGLVVDIEVPDVDLRCHILEARLRAAQGRDPSLTVGSDVLQFIANKVNGGGRELEGALNRVIANQQLTRARMTVDLAAMTLRDLAHAADVTRIRIDDILKVVGRHYNVARADLLSPRRARSIVRPRQVGMYLAKKLTPRSLPEIGRRFGGRDHSTVLHAVRKIEELILTDEHLAREVALLMRLIEQQ